MIRSKEDYKRFLSVEICNGDKPKHFLFLYVKTFFKPTSKFLLLLRTCEYYLNTNKISLLYYVVKFLKFKLSTKLGFSIPENVADEGLQLPHYGTIVINKGARLGKRCRVHACVNIGASGGSLEAPQIGDMVYIGPGAKIYGNIRIENRIAISANSVVNRSFLNSDRMIAGVPAAEIKKIDISNLIKT